MGSFKGKDSSGWKDTSAVYGKDASGWLYAKEAWAKNASGWQRAWTDCRQHDAGGRGWSDPVSVVTYTGTCGNRTQTTTITRTKTGCPNDVRATTVASPDCNSTCFTSSAVNCDSCGSATLYTANAGSGCTTYTDGSCGTWNNVTESYGYNTPFAFAGTEFYTEYVSALGGYRAFVYDNYNGSYDGGTNCGGSTAYHLLYTCSVNGNQRVTFVGCY